MTIGRREVKGSEGEGKGVPYFQFSMLATLVSIAVILSRLVG